VHAERHNRRNGRRTVETLIREPHAALPNYLFRPRIKVRASTAAPARSRRRRVAVRD
jgi:hypothetical protein